MPKVRVSAEASQELEEAVAWYEEQSPGLGSELIGEFEHAINLLQEELPPLTPMSGHAGEVGAKALSRIVVFASANS